MSVGDVTLSGCSLVTVTVLTRPLARLRCWPGSFGWALMVFNDALRARQDAQAAGERVSDTQVQPTVVTLAKTTPARGWLGGVASVASVQACQDARRAYRNWFDSLSGARRGRKVGHPRFRSRKDHRVWIRLTRNGFGITTGGVRVAKIGDVRLVWSRALPCLRVRAVISQPAAGTTHRLWGTYETPNLQAGGVPVPRFQC
jgi:putative transposase